MMKQNEMAKGIATGFEGLDKLLKGMQGGELVVLGARPAMGKTGFALEIVNYQAIGKGVPCLFFAVESSKEQIEERLRRIGGDGTYEKLRDGNSQIYIEDNYFITPDAFYALAREHKEKHNIGFIVIDYLQLMLVHQFPEFGEKAYEDALDKLKQLAVELDVPILIVSELSRELENREDKRPRFSDLDSLGIIQDKVDTILFLYRDDYYHPDTKKANTTEIIVAKNGQGEQGTVELGYEAGSFFERS